MRKQNLTDFQENALCHMRRGLMDKIKTEMSVLCDQERGGVQMVMQTQCKKLHPFLSASEEQP